MTPLRTADRGGRQEGDIVELGIGIGWRPEIAGAVESLDGLDWVEAVAENVCPGHLPDSLERLRARGVRIVPHGVSLGLGGADRPSPERLAALAERAEALGSPLVTEHIAFVRAGGALTASPALEAGHLLPVPRTRDALAVLCENIRIAQDSLPVPLAVENIAALLSWPDEELTEGQFLAELVERTGVRLLIDVANLHTNHVNRGEDPAAALDALPLEAIAYVHVAGGVERDGLWHDTHAHPVPPQVLAILTDLRSRIAPPGVLLERDDDFPPAAALAAELATIRTTLTRAAAPDTTPARTAAPGAPGAPGHPGGPPPTGAGRAPGAGHRDATGDGKMLATSDQAAADTQGRPAAGPAPGAGHRDPAQAGKRLATSDQAADAQGRPAAGAGTDQGDGPTAPVTAAPAGGGRPHARQAATAGRADGGPDGASGALGEASAETATGGPAGAGQATGHAPDAPGAPGGDPAPGGADGRPGRAGLPPGARERVGIAQAALLSALVAGTPAPAGFDRARLRVQSRALAAKRADVVAKVAPELPGILGDGYRPAFLAYARARPLRAGYRRDALDFAEHLLAAGRPENPAARRRLTLWWQDRAAPEPPGRATRIVRAARAVLTGVGR